MLLGTAGGMQLLRWSASLHQGPTVHQQTAVLAQSTGNCSLLFDGNLQANYYVAANCNGHWYIDRLLKDRPSECPLEVTPAVVVSRANSRAISRLALDWIHHLLFYINPASKQVEALKVASITISYVIVAERIDAPQDIVVNPLEGWIAWTDQGLEGHRPARIERASLDGTERRVLLEDTYEILAPTGLTLDLATRRLFWLDARLHSLSSMDFKGKDRRLVFQSAHFLVHPLWLDSLDASLYWTDAINGSVLSVSKFGLLDTAEHEPSVRRLPWTLGPIGGLKILDASKQPHGQPPLNETTCRVCPFLCDDKEEILEKRCGCPQQYQLYKGECLTETQHRLAISRKSLSLVSFLCQL